MNRVISLSTRLIWTSLLVLSLPIAAQTQWTDIDSDVLEICAAHKNVVIPQAELPTEKDRKELADCDSNVFYKGILAKPDYEKARKCAFIEREKDRRYGYPPVGGSAKLIEIYANGKGVARSHEKALFFACAWSYKDDGGRQVVRVIHELIRGLVERSKSDSPPDISICDDYVLNYSTSIDAGMCTSQSNSYERLEKLAYIEKYKEKWSPEKRVSYLRLNKAAEKFFSEEAEFRIYPGCGSWCSGQIGFHAAEEHELWLSFIDLLQKIERGNYPDSDIYGYKNADNELNHEYKILLRSLERDKDDPSLSPFPLKRSQRAWIKYRDAWEEYASAQEKPFSMKTYLTKERIWQLKRYMHENLLP